jgi:hypothetical protein
MDVFIIQTGIRWHKQVLRSLTVTQSSDTAVSSPVFRQYFIIHRLVADNHRFHIAGTKNRVRLVGHSVLDGWIRQRGSGMRRVGRL